MGLKTLTSPLLLVVLDVTLLKATLSLINQLLNFGIQLYDSKKMQKFNHTRKISEYFSCFRVVLKD